LLYSYVAPEILKGHPYDQAADMWSVGVVIYVALVGYPPFLEQDQRVMLDKIRRGEFEFYQEDWSAISSQARNLIKSLLKVNPDDRYSASQSLHHEWIADAKADELSKTSLKSSLDNLTKRSLDTLMSEASSTPFKSFSTLPN
jgi:serine/threonine protein kinase